MTAAEEVLAFLNAQLDVDEQKARNAATLCGCHPPAPVWEFDDVATDGRILIVDDPHPVSSYGRRKLGRRWNGTYTDMRAAQHIANHDPARALRQVAAMRLIVAEHEDQHECTDPHAAQYPYVGCRTLRLVASMYADRDGYQEGWRP